MALDRLNRVGSVQAPREDRPVKGSNQQPARRFENGSVSAAFQARFGSAPALFGIWGAGSGSELDPILAKVCGTLSVSNIDTGCPAVRGKVVAACEGVARSCRPGVKPIN